MYTAEPPSAQLRVERVHGVHALNSEADLAPGSTSLATHHPLLVAKT